MRVEHHICVLGFYNWNVIVISSFCYRVNEDLGPLGCYTVFIVNWLPTFQDDLSVLSSRIKQYKKTYWSFWPLKKAPIGCLETLVTYYQSVLYTSQNSKDPRLLSCNYESCMFTVSKTVVQSMLKMVVVLSFIKSIENRVPESILEDWCLRLETGRKDYCKI
jgi:hypothetical protein